jgi:predicted MPP superfamily phosphohydrolase
MLEFFQSYLPPAVLWLGGCAGHAFFLVVSLNVLYAWPLPHGLLKITRKIDIFLVLAGPVLFFLALNLHRDGWSAHTIVGGPLVTSYLLFCWCLGFFVVPVALVLYHLRRRPPNLLSNHTVMVDVARELGAAPIGRGKKRHLARLPYNQVFQVDIVERTFRLPQLPSAWDGLKILHLSDLHLCGSPDRTFYQYILDRCQQDYVPDLVALTGDVVDSGWHHRWIVPVLGRLRWNVAAFAILGNHDAWQDVPLIRRRLRRLRMDVLGNSWKQIDVRGQPMIVIGNESPWFKPQPDLSACPPDVFRFCLSHTPDTIAWARRNRIDLMLAGHVHGGQIRFPLIGSVFVPSRYSRRYDCGSFFEEPTLMHVSRGLAGQHPLRFNCRPEITKIVLRAG